MSIELPIAHGEELFVVCLSQFDPIARQTVKIFTLLKKFLCSKLEKFPLSGKSALFPQIMHVYLIRIHAFLSKTFPLDK